MVDVAKDFGVARSKIRNVWVRASVNVLDPRQPCSDVAARVKGRVGRKQVHQSIVERLRAIPKARLTTFRSVAAVMKVPKSTLHRYYKKGMFVKYSSVLKPALTDANKMVRLKWALDAIKLGQSQQAGWDFGVVASQCDA
ncbi:hypothetical protein H310_08391 [Aphanomyces invadans]|uniref:Uncharacterized protein n=1 Tax=Aphanomyces invadans TaxID=157072 RepID=A0A024TY63_9STRA|nr:hypothetical protein H310_08391 [Aphanomyces invadans]ETV98899.1 hypothetical protein H310_08391 [Aphanomyces invadans]|eukprot:XP_008872327.1 hypothetical protein H310_08391 [Aphanomyces invadans]